MHRRNNLFPVLVVIALVVSIVPFSASANSPPDAEFTERYLGAGETILMMTLISIPGIVLTVVSEAITAVAFGFDLKSRSIICLVNFVSQIVMRTLFVFIHVLINHYLISIIAVEFLVYLGEYLVYCKVFKDISIKRRLFFTIMANTVSLLLGLWMNDWLLFVMFAGG